MGFGILHFFLILRIIELGASDLIGLGFGQIFSGYNLLNYNPKKKGTRARSL